VVYAPFYRLLGDSDGSAACHNATISDIVSDAEAALAWVRQNASNFGSSSTPVVFGQSAGGHLAASLAINQPSNVAAGILFYPPTDFTDFALRVIVEGDLDIPPLLMVQGMQDELVESRQSVRLCDALAGRQLLEVDEEVEAIVGLRQTISCGADSSLQLIREGQHALDVCLADLSISTDLCLSGSAASRREVASALLDASNFALENSAATTNVVPVRRGGGSLNFMMLVLFLLGLQRRIAVNSKPIS